MWLYFMTVFLSCCGLALLQENECKDTLPHCSGLITQETKMACYEENLGETGVAISRVCCETCQSFKDPNALEGCEYGDKSFVCSQQNCTNPTDEGTGLCCKTCRANIEAELASLTTTQSAQGETTASVTSAGPSTPPNAVQNTGTQAIETTTAAEAAAASTTLPLASSTPITTTIASVNTPPSLAPLPTTAAQETTANPQSTIESVTTNGPSQQDTSTTVAPDVPATSPMTSTTAPSQQETSTSAPSQQATTAATAAVESAKTCIDDGKCKNIRSHQCYSTYTRERCCESCKMIAETKTKDCPYGDRLPLWCVLQILRSPRTICISHDDLCCESCQYVGPSTTRSRVLLLRRKPTLWEKIKKEHKKKGGKKGKKSKRKDKKSKGKKGKGKGKKSKGKKGKGKGKKNRRRH